MASRWPSLPASYLAFTFHRRNCKDQSEATDGSDFLCSALEETHRQEETKCGRAEMFCVIQRCRRLVPSVFTRTLSPALTAARHSLTLRRNFALKFFPCQCHWFANSSNSVNTRSYWEQSAGKDGDAAAMNGEATDVDRRNDRQGSAVIEVSSKCHSRVPFSSTIRFDVYPPPPDFICHHFLFYLLTIVN